MRRFLTLVLIAAFATIARPAVADEGMWTLDNFPEAAVAKQYGFKATPAFLDKLRAASVRLPGCSGSFVSGTGLIMTNHHCARGCITYNSSEKNDYIKTGFFAAKQQDELVCPGFSIVSLVSIADVTKTVNVATAGTAGAGFNAAERAVFSKLENACAPDKATQQCQVVTLYNGGRYALYAYRKYSDVRLVFAPEEAAAFFGGDPDNFNFPRFDLDCAFMRVYQDGKPMTSPNFFRWSTAGAAANELIFVPGNPGSTSRLDTVAELEYLRDVQNIAALRGLSERRGLYSQFATESVEHARQATSVLFGIENSLKATVGHETTLLDPAFMAKKRAQEAADRAAIAKNSVLAKKFGGAYDAIATAERRARDLQTTFTYRERDGAPGFYLATARTLVRAAAERIKPDAQRLRGFNDAALPQLVALLTASRPIFTDLEKTTLAYSLTKTREFLGPDDAYVKALLGNDSPEIVAARVTEGSKLADPAVRKALYDGGAAAIAASTDPAIALVRATDAMSRVARQTYEDQVGAPIAKNDALVARAQFALHGLTTYPDATFTLRVTYGTVKGWTERGTPIAPFTTFGGAFAHATGSDPFALPASWIAARNALDPKTPLDFTSTADIIGGNSGSPVVNAKAEIVGLIFDGNIHSLGGDYGYDLRDNRAVAVDSVGLLAALRTIYHADRLATELAP